MKFLLWGKLLVLLFVFVCLEWNGLSLEGGSERRKRKEERKKNLGNFNFGNAPVVYAEFRITGNYRLSAYPLK